jgi:hypothetical protein
MSGRAGSTRKRARSANKTHNKTHNKRGRANNNNSEDTVLNRNMNDAMQIRLTDFAKTIFGEDTVKKLMDRGINPRKLWSLSTNITQCNNVIGTHKGNCWICETPIRNVKGLAPECEHILPVAQAVIFLSLYSAKREYGRPKNNNYAKMAKDPEFEHYVKEFPPLKINAKNDKAGYDMLYHLEYGWAHQICNQEKSDICAIVSKNGKAEVSIKNVKYILKKIYKSEREGHEKLHELFNEKGYTTEDEFVKGCTNNVLKRYNEIVNFLNKTAAKDMNRFNLTLLSGVVTALDISNMREEGHDLIDPDYLKRQKEMKDLLTVKIKEDLRSHLGYSIDMRVVEFVNNQKPPEIKNNEELKEIIQQQIDKYKKFTLYSYANVYTKLAKSQGHAYNAARIHAETVKHLVEFISAHIFSEILKDLSRYREERERIASPRAKSRGVPVGDDRTKGAIQYTINTIEASNIYKFLSGEYKIYYSTDNLNLLAKLANAAHPMNNDL